MTQPIATNITEPQTVSAARVLAVIWGSFRAVFGVVSDFGEGLDFAGILQHGAVPGASSWQRR